jgi:lysophospholipase L1-like esterase
MFRGAPEKSKELPSHYSVVAKRCRCHFLNATEIAAASFIDGVHMDRRGHRLLSEALARKLVLLFNQNMSMNRDL